MKTTLSVLAMAGLMGSISAPAFAAAHMSTSMTCSEYKGLGADDQMKVMMMAMGELHSNEGNMPSEGEPKATEDSIGHSTGDEATDSTTAEGSVSDGEPKAVEATGGNEPASNLHDAPMDEVAMEQFMTICDQNLDATVSEAAFGMGSTRK